MSHSANKKAEFKQSPSVSNVKKSKYLNSKSAWFILSAGWAFYVYEYFLRASPGVMTDQIMGHFGITAGALGILISFYYMAYVPLQLPCGVVVDYFGPRKIVTFSALLCVCGAILFSHTNSLLVAKLGRFLIGAGSACAYLACMKIASVWFDSSKFAFIAGVSQMLGALGGMVGNSPLAYVVNATSWQITLFYSACGGIVIALFSWFVIRDRPQDLPVKKKAVKTHVMQDLKAVVNNKQNLLVALYGCLTNLVVNVFAELWGVPFLMERYNISNEVAAAGTTAVFIGFATGCLLSSLFADYFKSHVKILSMSALSIMVGFSLVIWAVMPFNLTLFILFVTSVFAGMQILYFTVATRNSPKNAAATTIGFINTFVVFGGMVFQPILGLVLEFFWDGSVKESGIANYSLFAYQSSLSMLVVCSFVALCLTYFIRETYKTRR
ncbi:MAG: MFS transporter [Alphaproteobacteria bacterium CG_4_10_14_0_8_um_filter_37_21]|nr:MAG: MFS transporter [Alphaproteobacteria bacterium CG_4_10_14_0_8_um_filter_37_21]